MTELMIAFFLCTALILYVILGGADFGAGILELFAPGSLKKEIESTTYRAIGPVWEANHMWLILAVVILFVAYPTAYSTISVYLHIPLTILLFAIVGRGCAFAFRHYDAVQDESQRRYSLLFVTSSLLAPFFMGVSFGALLAGTIPPQPLDFFSSFIAPWCTPLSFSIGLFVCTLCTTLASVFLLGETTDQEQLKFFRKAASFSNLTAIVASGLVFVAGEMQGLALIQGFLSSSKTLGAVFGATLCLLLTFLFIQLGKIVLMRIAVAGQIVCILLGWFLLHYPVILRFNDGSFLTAASAMAPQATLQVLLCALVIGSLVIFPFLGYLFFVFKRTESRTRH